MYLQPHLHFIIEKDGLTDRLLRNLFHFLPCLETGGRFRCFTSKFTDKYFAAFEAFYLFPDLLHGIFVAVKEYYYVALDIIIY